MYVGMATTLHAPRTQKVEVYTFYLTLVWLSAPIPVPSVVLSCPYLGMMVEKVFCNRPYLGMMVEKVFWASHTFYLGIFGNVIPRWYRNQMIFRYLIRKGRKGGAEYRPNVAAAAYPVPL